MTTPWSDLTDDERNCWFAEKLGVDHYFELDGSGPFSDDECTKRFDPLHDWNDLHRVIDKVRESTSVRNLRRIEAFIVHRRTSWLFATPSEVCEAIYETLK